MHVLSPPYAKQQWIFRSPSGRLLKIRGLSRNSLKYVVEFREDKLDKAGQLHKHSAVVFITYLFSMQTKRRKMVC